jgi:hypothetical protein
MQFLLQFVISYGAALLIASIALTRGGPGTATIALIYGFVGLPFGLIAGVLSRLLERLIGWPAAIVAMALVLPALYLVAPNKNNFWAGIGMIMPFAVMFAAAWSFLSWRRAFAGG